MTKPSLRVTSLGSVAKVISGFAFKSAEFNETGIPVIKIRNIQLGEIDLTETQCVPEHYLSIDIKYHVHFGDILISLTGSHINQPNSVVGRVARYRRGLPKALLNQRAGKVLIRKPDKCDTGFLYYHLYVEEIRREIAAFAHGAANQANVSPGQIESLCLYLPSLPTQRKIAAILSAYDDLIENNRRRIKIMEEMAQNLYREWFVKFRFPGHQQAHFNDSPLGPIPEGWEVSSVRNASSLVSRGPSLKYSDKEGIPVLNQRCVRDGEISLDTIQHAEPLGKNKEHLYLRQYDILINSMGVGTLGRVSRNVSIIEKMIIHNCITVVRPDVSRVSAPQLFYCIKDNQTRFESLGVGATGQTSLRPEVIKETSILLPTEEVSKQFSHFVLPLWDQVGVLKRRNEVLRRTRDLLLPRLISGEVDVSELDIAIPEEAIA